MRQWGPRIRNARHEAGLTQVALAALVGVDQTAVSQWERGAGISDDSKLRLATALDKDPGDLFPWSDIVEAAS